MKKLMAIVLALLIAMSACAFAEAQEDIVITVGKEFDYNGKTFINDHTLEDNYYSQYIYQQHGIKFEYEWILTDDASKQALAVASGNMPDVMLTDLTTYNMLLQSNMLADLTQAFEENANQYLLDARTYYPETFKATTVGGKLMAIGHTATTKQHQVLWVRQDWLDNLDLEAPTNLDEVAELARAFVEQDPDGNGENDTIGLTLNKKIIGNYQADHDATPIGGVFKAFPRIWYQDEDGSVVYGSVTPETRDALEYLAWMYAEGLIDPQFAVRDQAEVVVSGKCGMFFGTWCAGPLSQSYGYDKADWVPVLAPLDDEGNFNTTLPVPTATYLVVSKDCEHPEAVIKALGAEYDFHRYLTGDPEQEAKMNEYQNAGVSWTIMPLALQLEAEDIVATRGRDMIQMIETGSREGISKQNQAFYDAWLKFCEDPSYLTGWLRYKGMYLACNTCNAPENVYVAPCFWDMTDTMKEVWTTLQSMEDEVFMKIVMGEAGIEAFDQFVEEWMALGGETIIDEVQAYVDAR